MLMRIVRSEWGSGVAVTGGVLIGVASILGYVHLNRSRDVPLLTRADLPEGAVLIWHHHPLQPLAPGEESKVEMEHFATHKAIENGGPIYGVYGYRIVAIEYEVPIAGIGVRPVGDEDPGFALSRFLLQVPKVPTYDHVHIGRAENHDAAGGHATHAYLIHFMLISHDEELKIGLSCS